MEITAKRARFIASDDGRAKPNPDVKQAIAEEMPGEVSSRPALPAKAETRRAITPAESDETSEAPMAVSPRRGFVAACHRLSI